MRISDPAKKKEADAATHARQQLAKAGERKDAWQKREEALDALLDTAVARVVVRRAAPGTAEPSVRRALEALPAVGVGPAFAEGPRVRGLRADGFEVLLDGDAPQSVQGAVDTWSVRVVGTQVTS